MKNTILLSVVAFASAFYVAATPISVKSKIESVTVYRQGAEVVNIATVDVPAGLSEVVFEGLSNYVNPGSLQVSGTSGITLLSAVFQQNYLRLEEKLPAVIKIEDSLDVLNLDLSRLAARKNVFKEEESMLKVNQSIGGDNTGISVVELQKAADFMRTRLTEVKNKIIDLEQDEKELNEKITRLKNQLSEYNQKKDRPAGEVLLNISAKAAKSITFRLSYLVTGAGWDPVYDIRADKLNEPVTLVYKANVYQNTGVKWENVKLALSTGNPTVGQTSPVLNTWFIDFYNPYTGRYDGIGYEPKQLEQVVIKSSKVENYDGEDLEDYKLKEQVVITENQINVEFQIEIPYTIPSDGKEQLVAMDEFQLNAGYTYYAVPKIETDAFLVADVTGWEDVHLLAGKANIFFEGNYIGQSQIDPKATGDTLRVSFGRDNKVNIKRELLKDFTSKKFIATNKKETFGYEISIKNTKAQNIKIEIDDQVPISNNSQITIEAEELSGADYNKETGKLKWKFELAPSESKQMRLVYSVKYPKNKTIAGL